MLLQAPWGGGHVPQWPISIDAKVYKIIECKSKTCQMYETSKNFLLN